MFPRRQSQASHQMLVRDGGYMLSGILLTAVPSFDSDPSAMRMRSRPPSCTLRTTVCIQRQHGMLCPQEPEGSQRLRSPLAGFMGVTESRASIALLQAG
jgi:hypothetical protein